MTGGYTENKTVTLTISESFNVNHCNVVAFVFRDDTKQVIQAEYRHVIEE